MFLRCYICSVYTTIFLLTLSLFFFNDPATTEIYTLSLHDALPISRRCPRPAPAASNENLHSCLDRSPKEHHANLLTARSNSDRKSTRLNSSHVEISYAVFCLKKKKKKKQR